MKPGSNTPAPDDVCQREGCGQPFYTHSLVLRYCPTITPSAENPSVFIPAPAPIEDKAFVGIRALKDRFSHSFYVHIQDQFQVKEQRDVNGGLKLIVLQPDSINDQELSIDIPAEVIANTETARENEALKQSLSKMLAYMDSGYLVRDISKDHEPGFVFKAAMFVVDLKQAVAVARHKPNNFPAGGITFDAKGDETSEQIKV